MSSKVKIITDKIVNCYLVKTDDGFFMVDTGVPVSRGTIEKALAKAGCRRGNLKLVVITHWDYDHMGNGAYLRKKYGAKIAVHRNEAIAVERGDMLSDRKTRLAIILRVLIAIFRPVVFRRFKPDIYFEGERDLAEYGIDARVFHIPGHSLGSIGVLTGDGDFFCGDLLINDGRPGKNKLIDDEAEMDASISMLRDLDIRVVYPGHGRPFTMEEFFSNNPQ